MPMLNYRKYAFFIVLLIAFSSCKKKQNNPSALNNTIEDTTSTSVLSKLVVNVSGMKNSNGKVNFALYNSESSFNEPNQAYKEIFANAIEGNMSFVLDSLPAGEYTFAVFHDENSNSEIDQNWLGIPSEGFAFSNNAMGSFGPPSYSQAKFTITSKSIVSQNISLNFY
jgi:uncharacterized protein (DUF2141 family)